ncbi:MAG: hypothetical protein V4572_07485 [Bacteroidota bacterium]
MKYTYIILLFINLTGYSQNISLDEIISIKNKNLLDVKNLLIPKGWFIFSELEPTKSESGVFVFAVKSKSKNKHQDFSTYESFIKYHFTLDSKVDKINYNTRSEKAYKTILKRLGELNYKKISNENEIESNKMIFSNEKNLIEISTMRK